MRKLNWILCALALTACATPTVSSSRTEEPSGTESSKTYAPNLPKKIYLYQEGNVPFDGEESAREYAFLTPYLPSKPSGGAVIVLPGGGYTHLSNSTPDQGKKNGGRNNEGDQKEASAIATLYNAAGIAVFVLNYRTTCVDQSCDYHALLSDVHRAIRVVRNYSEECGFDAGKICLQGYSAGGHLSLMGYEQAGLSIVDQSYRKDAIDELSCLPNAFVLGYPVVSFLDGKTHASTRKTFTGGDPSLYEAFSAELHVDEDFPSTYLFHEKHDPTVPCKGSQDLAEALDFLGVDYKFDCFQDQASEDTPLHGFGVTDALEEASSWTGTALAFLQERGF